MDTIRKVWGKMQWVKEKIIGPNESDFTERVSPLYLYGLVNIQIFVFIRK